MPIARRQGWRERLYRLSPLPALRGDIGKCIAKFWRVGQVCWWHLRKRAPGGDRAGKKAPCESVAVVVAENLPRNGFRCLVVFLVMENESVVVARVQPRF